MSSFFSNAHVQLSTFSVSGCIAKGRQSCRLRSFCPTHHKWSVTQSLWKTLKSGTQPVSATQEIAGKRAAFLRAQQALRAAECMGNRNLRRRAQALAGAALAGWRRIAWAASAVFARQRARCAACLLQGWRCWRRFTARQARPQGIRNLASAAVLVTDVHCGLPCDLIARVCGSDGCALRSAF